MRRGGYILLALGVQLLLVALYLLRTEQPLLPFSYTCHSPNFCTFQNLCIDEEHGLFVFGTYGHSPRTPPVMPCAVPLPSWFFNITPKVVVPPKDFPFVLHQDRTLVISGSFSPFHLAHLLINNAVPLWTVIERHLPEGRRTRRDLLTIGKFPNQREMTYGFPIDYLGFDKLYAASYLVPGSNTQPEEPLRIRSGLNISETPLRGKGAVCYAHATLGLDDTCIHCSQSPTREEMASFRQQVLGFYSIPHDRRSSRVIVVQREKTRRILNLDEVEGLLASLGIPYQVEMLTGVPFEKQVELFSSASLVIAPHGNAASHIHWMAEGTSFVEAFGPSKYGLGYFTKLCLSKGVQHHPLLCNDPRCKGLKGAKIPKLEDMYVDIEALEETLRKVLRL